MSQPISERTNGGVKYLYMAAAFVIVISGLRAAEAIINPLLLAIFLSVISAPAYFELMKRGVAEWLALLTVMAVLGILTLGVVLLVTRSIASFTSQQEFYRDQLREKRAEFMQVASGWLPHWQQSKEPKSDTEATDADNTSKTDASPTEAAESQAAESETTEGDDASRGAAITENRPEPIAAETDSAKNLANDFEEEGTTAENVRSEVYRTNVEFPRSLHFPHFEDRLPDSENSWTEYMSEQFDPGTVISLAASVAGSIGQLLSNAILILLTVVFILLEAGSMRKKLGDAVERSEDVRQRAAQVVSSLRHYFVIKTWVSLATGVLVAIWLQIFNVSHAPLWGLLAFLFNYIPNVGSFLAAIPAILVAWLEVGNLPALASAVGFVLVNALIGNFLEPRLMGKGLGLSPLIVFCSMVFWGWVLGPVGMLLSVPLTMTARIVLDGFDDTKWIATLMGNVE